jgi:hypothetical protein
MPALPQSLQAYATTKRVEWVREWPAMVVLAVSQIYWSRQVEAAIASGNVAGYLAQVRRPAWTWCCSKLPTATHRACLSSMRCLCVWALCTH